jgi:hypothetical protein
MQYHAYFSELERVSYITSNYFPKIAKKAYGLIIFGTIKDGDASLDACCCFSIFS